MSRSLYSLDREAAQKLLTRNNLAKPPRPKVAAPVDRDAEINDFAQLKTGPAAFPSSTPVAPVPAPQSGPDPRLVQQEEKWLQSQLRIKELEEALSQVALDNEKTSAMKQKSAELEGRNRLLEDQLDSLNKKLQSSDQKTERLVANLETFKAAAEGTEKSKNEEAEKWNAEIDAFKLKLAEKESEAAAAAGMLERISLLELEKNDLLQNKLILEGERRQYEEKITSLGDLLAKAQAGTKQLQDELEQEKEKAQAGAKQFQEDLDQEKDKSQTGIKQLQEELGQEKAKALAASEADAEQISKLRKQVETARELLTQAAEDNVRLERERNEAKIKLQSTDIDKADWEKQKQTLEADKKKLSEKGEELDRDLAKVRADLLQLEHDLDIEKKRTTVLQAEADQLPDLRKELASKGELLDKALENLTRVEENSAKFERERDDLSAQNKILESEKSELAAGKASAEADTRHFSSKLNELGKDLLKAQTDVGLLRNDLEAEKAKPVPELNAEEIDRLKQAAETAEQILAKAVEEKVLAQKDRDEWKGKVEALEIESNKAKDALKQAVMAYHEARVVPK